MTKDVDYKTTHFEYPELTPIHGEPTTKDLITLKRQINSNAITVHTTLGGGHYGHLGMTTNPATYATIPNTQPYQRPNAPGNINIPANATQYQIAQLQEQHAEDTCLLREVLAVEPTLIQQIVAAVEPKYLKSLRDPITNKITCTIPEILTHLFDAYGHVTPTELYELKQKVEQMQFSPQEPIDTLITEVDDLADVADLAGSPLTDRQRVDMAYIVLQRCKPFKMSLREWNGRPVADRTWNNFKNHFREAQISLRKTGEITIEEGINHTEMINLVSKGVRAALEEHEQPREETANNVEETNSDLRQQLDEMRQMLEQMNAVQQAIPNQQNTMQMQYPAQPWMQTQPQYQQYTPPQHKFYQGHQFQEYNQGGRGGRGRSNRYGRDGRNGRGGRGGRGASRRERKYCWTHGLCAHNRKECNSPAQGHQQQATLENRMGGNTNGCA